MNDLRLDPNEWFDDPPIPGDDEDYITDEYAPLPHKNHMHQDLNQHLTLRKKVEQKK